jgi:hypothetical protein
MILGSVTFGNGGERESDTRGLIAFIIVAVILAVVWDRTIGRKK